LSEFAVQENLESVIFDLDGTLADVRHRLPLIKGEGKPDWPAFFDACVDDLPNNYVIRLNHILYRCMTVFIASGRPDTHLSQTRHWLKKHQVRYHRLLMRKAKDYRPDTIVKKEMLDQIRSWKFNPVFAVDDRPAVVQMWRENDVPCFVVDDAEWKE
jgi:phosphoglycolate phosphatase-like HAD superfamily hydrolase